jgi:hypothetical protein
MLDIHCDYCFEEIKIPSALLIGPPNAQGLCSKRHICVDCYEGGHGIMIREKKGRREKEKG